MIKLLIPVLIFENHKILNENNIFIIIVLLDFKYMYIRLHSKFSLLNFIQNDKN